MGSPQIEVFSVFDDDGVPLAGVVGDMSFATYKDDSGTNVTPPSITEIGGGIYKFTPAFPVDTTKGVVYMLQTGHNPAYYSRYVRREDWLGDNLRDLLDAQFGRWKIYESGPFANQLVLYREDDTILKQFDLKDLAGDPAFLDVFERVPV